MSRGYTRSVPWVYNECPLGIQWISPGYAMNVPWVKLLTLLFLSTERSEPRSIFAVVLIIYRRTNKKEAITKVSHFLHVDFVLSYQP